MDVLTKHDLQNLENSFITESLANTAGLSRVNNIEGASIVGHKPIASRDYSGIVFPYRMPESENPREYQLRLDEPFDPKMKYLFPPGTRNMFYFPPTVTKEELQDISIPIVITEGVKKALALEELATNGTDKRRFIPIAVGGVWSWKGKIGTDDKGVIDDFNFIVWKGRDTSIVFDADTNTNPKVRQARTQLAKILEERNARVFYADVPQIDGEKCGIDDVLGKWQSDFDTQTAVQNGLELLKSKKLFVTDKFTQKLFDGKLILIAKADTRGKTQITAKNEKQDIIYIDSFNLADAIKRAKFVNSLGFNEEENIEISRTLLTFADRVECLNIESNTVSNGETIPTSFIQLKDGRIVEQVKDGLAVYNKENDSFEVVESVQDSDGTTYTPTEDDLLKLDTGGIYLAKSPTEYETKKELIAEIENYVNKYVDLKPLYLKLVSYYILFSYLFDKVLELSYISATGDLGSGKSRLGMTIALASYRGYLMVNPTAATLYRVIDRFSPTLFIDEFNSNANADDTQAIIQVLNTGFNKLSTISRQTKDQDGNFKTEVFNPYCPKIIGSYKESASDPLKSRNIEIQMERSYRDDLPIRLTHSFLNEAQELRNKLVLFRLREFENDLEAKLDCAEIELRKANITPRSVQINIPLYALIDDKDLKQEFIQLLQQRDKVLVESKRQSFDGELVEAIQTILFDFQESEIKDIATWKKDFPQQPEDKKICEALRTEKITGILNNERERDLNVAYVGKEIIKLGLSTKKIRSRQSEYRDKKAIVFDAARLKLLFDNFDLPIPEDFAVPTVPTIHKINNGNNLEMGTDKNNKGNSKNSCPHANTSETKIYGNGDGGDRNTVEIKLKSKTDRILREI